MSSDSEVIISLYQTVIILFFFNTQNTILIINRKNTNIDYESYKNIADKNYKTGKTIWDIGHKNEVEELF